MINRKKTKEALGLLFFMVLLWNQSGKFTICTRYFITFAQTNP